MHLSSENTLLKNIFLDKNISLTFRFILDILIKTIKFQVFKESKMDNMVKNQKDTGHKFLFTSESVGEGHPGKKI